MTQASRMGKSSIPAVHFFKPGKFLLRHLSPVRQSVKLVRSGRTCSNRYVRSMAGRPERSTALAPTRLAEEMASEADEAVEKARSRSPPPSSLAPPTALALSALLPVPLPPPPPPMLQMLPFPPPLLLPLLKYKFHPRRVGGSKVVRSRKRPQQRWSVYLEVWGCVGGGVGLGGGSVPN